MMQKIHPAVRVIAFLLALEGCVGMTLAGLPVFRWAVLVFVPILWFYILFLVINRRKMARRIYFLGGVGFMALLGECMQMCFGGFPMFKWLIYIFSPLTWVYMFFGTILSVAGELDED